MAISSTTILNNTVKTWGFIALLGQWFFAVYIMALYAIPLATGVAADVDDISPARGFDLSASFNSVMFFSHILPAALMALSGLFQLLPNVRNRYPSFHRWNGRMFFVLGLSGAITGLYLTWGAGIRFSNIASMGVTLNGILILVAIFFAWRAILNKKIIEHQRWAVHSFVLVNGVWSLRLYLMGWYLVNQGPNGNKPTLDGPMDLFLSFACYLLPMLFVELIFWAKRRKNEKINWIVIGTTGVATLFTAIGLVAAGVMMWGPRVSQALSVVFS